LNIYNSTALCNDIEPRILVPSLSAGVPSRPSCIDAAM
jgi:hypothetical protein